MRVLIVLCLAAVLATMVEARSEEGIVYPFSIDTILSECRIPSAIAGETMSQGIPTLPLVPGANDEVWLPPAIPFAAPSGTADVPWLRQELERFRDGEFDTIQFETQPLPGDPIGDPTFVIEGSGRFPPVDTTNRTKEQLAALGYSQAQQDIICDWFNRISFTNCDDAINEVAELPPYYYPRFFVSGRCSGSDCSLPRGQNCLPSPRNTVLLPVLRWDCCWDYEGAVWRWACGWRRVNIQIVTQCYCACRPVF